MFRKRYLCTEHGPSPPLGHQDPILTRLLAPLAHMDPDPLAHPSLTHRTHPSLSQSHSPHSPRCSLSARSSGSGPALARASPPWTVYQHIFGRAGCGRAAAGSRRRRRSMLQSLLPRWLDQLPAVDHGSQHSRPLCGSGLPEVRTARQEGAELRRVYPFWPGDQASQVSHTTFADTQTFAQAPCPRRGRGEADIGPSEGPNRGRMLVRDAASGAMQPLLQILSARSSSQTCARHRPQGAETEPGRQQAGDSDGRSATPVSGIADLAV